MKGYHKKGRRGLRGVISTGICLAMLCSYGMTAVSAETAEDSPNMEEVPTTIGPIIGLPIQVPPEFALHLENESLAVCLNEQTLAMKVYNKQTGYLWESGRVFSEDEAINDSWANRINTGVTLEYHDSKKNKPNTVSSTKKDAEISIKPEGDTLTVAIDFADLEITLDVIVTLDENRLSVNIPAESVTEGERYQLKNVMLFPFLGSTDQSQEEGYLLIPDGCGAIMEYNDEGTPVKSPLQKNFYGTDAGVTQTGSNAYPLTIPLYGVVHEVDQNAFYAHIESGSAYATLQVYPAGVTTAYDWSTFSFAFRQNFFMQTGRDGSGFVDLESERAVYPIAVTYSFLSGEAANYVGIATDYREQFLTLGSSDAKPQNDPFVHLSFLGAEIEKRVLSFRTNPLTTGEALESMVSDLSQQGVSPLVEYFGTAEGGYGANFSRAFPLERKLGKTADFEKIAKQFAEQLIPFYLGGGYHTDRLDRFPFRKSDHILKRIDQQLGAFDLEFENYTIAMGNLRLDTRVSDFSADVSEATEMGAAVAVGQQPLYSDYGSGKNREELLQQTAEGMTSKDVAVAYHAPPEYLFGEMSAYLSMPMDSSRYVVYTQEVPFLQAVFKGEIPYYALPMNQSGNTQRDLLKMIEFGSYPSYVLTEESPLVLVNTPSQAIMSSRYDVWKEEIIKTEALIKEALSGVQDAHMVSHQNQDGIGITKYDNGTTIYVNETNRAVTVDGVEVPSESFVVQEGEER